MFPSFEEIIQSPQFTFIIGEERKPFIVHAAAMAATSEPMDCLINGEMGEAQARCAELKDIKAEDFTRFCEYAYRGDYTVPHWTIEESPTGNGLPAKIPQPAVRNPLPEASWTFSVPDAAPVYEEPPPPPPEPEDSWGYPSVSLKTKKKKGKFVEEPEPPLQPSSRTRLRAHLEARNYLVNGSPQADILDKTVPQTNTTALQSFTEVFLAHARLYSFANMRLIAPLKALTLHKLHRTLMDFNLYVNRVGDIIELARYAYSNDHTEDRNGDGTINELRKLVVEYIAYQIDTIGNTVEFVELMEEGGEFVGDFWGIVRTHLI